MWTDCKSVHGDSGASKRRPDAQRVEGGGEPAPHAGKRGRDTARPRVHQCCTETLSPDSGAPRACSRSLQFICSVLAVRTPVKTRQVSLAVRAPGRPFSSHRPTLAFESVRRVLPPDLTPHWAQGAAAALVRAAWALHPHRWRPEPAPSRGPVRF